MSTDSPFICGPRAVLAVLGMAAICWFAGCAEGPLWRTGRFSPKVVDRWKREEQIANSVFERRRMMSETASTALTEGGDSLNRAARELGQIAVTDPVLIIRMEAVRQLAKLNCPSAWDALRRASADPEAEIRLAAVQAWRNMSADQALPALTSMFKSDASIDVRLAAVRMMGDFPGRSAEDVLRTAIGDADPAIQLRATQSLARITGKDFGPNVRAWAEYLDANGDSSAQVAEAVSPGETTR